MLTNYKKVDRYKKAFITLLSSVDYLPAVLVLNKSLRLTKSNYELVVAVTKDIVDKVQLPLIKEGIFIEKIPKLSYTKKVIDSWSQETSTIQNTASKIAIFGLTSYEHLIYIDADVLVLKNIDELFNYPVGSILWDGNICFSGLFSFRPSNYSVNWLLDIITNEDIVDGDLLAGVFNTAITDLNYRIPDKYLLHIMMWERLTEKQDIKVVHFCLNKYKPWITEIPMEGKTLLNAYSKLVHNFQEKYK